jgi:predicted ester cyclase
MSEANKEIIRRYQDAYNANNLDVLDEVLAPDWKTNGWPQGVPQSIEAAKSFYPAILESLPDIHYDTIRLVAEGDWVVQQWIMRGTFKGELAGLPPTGEVVECAGISMFRIAEGKIVEHWTHADESKFWHRMGVEVPEVMLGFGHGTDADLTA